MARYHCYVPSCDVSVKASNTFGKAISELSRHFNRGEHGREEKFDHAKACKHNESALQENMAEARPQREKKPTEKVKVATPQNAKTDDKEYPIPPKYVMPALADSKWAQEPKEIAKIYDHTKTSQITGEKIDFYKLGNQLVFETVDRNVLTSASPASSPETNITTLAPNVIQSQVTFTQLKLPLTMLASAMKITLCALPNAPILSSPRTC
jgi:hypothetical protein